MSTCFKRTIIDSLLYLFETYAVEMMVKPIYEYTQFAIQDSCLFGTNPWKILAPP